MLRPLKLAGLSVGKSLGLLNVVFNSSYRTSRVLVLGYHGFSLDDEHLCNPHYYMTAESFRGRLEAIRRHRCNVLPLAEAVARSANGTLPERSVVLTIDDGTHDFFRVARPLLQEYGYPATLYLTTYYVEHFYPNTPNIWGYMLWKARGKKVSASDFFGQDLLFDLTHQAGRDSALTQISAFNRSEFIDADYRHRVTEKLAEILGLNLSSICDKGICQSLSSDEVRELARLGLSIQMHMHVHMSPSTRQAYTDNLESNRHFIAQLTNVNPTHFCYPCGNYNSQRVDWLRQLGISSAVTADPGLLSSTTDRLLIPRFLDSSVISELEFEGWLTGCCRASHTPFRNAKGALGVPAVGLKH